MCLSDSRNKVLTVVKEKYLSATDIEMIRNAEGASVKQDEAAECINPESCVEIEIEAIEPPMKRQRVSLNKYNLRNLKKPSQSASSENLLKIKEF